MIHEKKKKKKKKDNIDIKKFSISKRKNETYEDQ